MEGSGALHDRRAACRRLRAHRRLVGARRRALRCAAGLRSSSHFAARPARLALRLLRAVDRRSLLHLESGRAIVRAWLGALGARWSISSVAILLPRAAIWRVAAIALVIAVLVDILFRLYHTPWLDAFRLTLRGKLAQCRARLLTLWNIGGFTRLGLSGAWRWIAAWRANPETAARPLHLSPPPLSSAPNQSGRKHMRAEPLALKAEIEQSVGLLRRHL